MKRFNQFQLAGKPGGGTSSHILGGITRRENLPRPGDVEAIGEDAKSVLKDKRYSSAKAPAKVIFSGQLSDIGKP